MADYTDPEQVKALSHVDEGMQKWIDAIPKEFEVNWDDLNDVRMKIGAMGNNLPDIEEHTKLESTISIPLRGGRTNTVRVHKAADISSKSPVIVLYFGGGFVVGNGRFMQPMARAVSQCFNATVFCPDYRLAPEHSFPAGAEDAWETLEWVAANAPSFGGDPTTGFIVGGTSAGGNLAAVVMQKSLNDKLHPPVTGQWLNVPALLAIEIVPDKYKHLFLAREQNRNAPMFDRKAVDSMERELNPDYTSPMYSPVNALDAGVKMPPTYIAVNGGDPLRDDGLVYATMLQDWGVDTRVDAFPGAPHPWYSPEKGAAVLRGMAWLLGERLSQEAIGKALPLWVF